MGVDPYIASISINAPYKQTVSALSGYGYTQKGGETNMAITWINIYIYIYLHGRASRHSGTGGPSSILYICIYMRLYCIISMSLARLSLSGWLP